MSQIKEIAIIRSLNPTKEFKIFVRDTEDKTEWCEIVDSPFGPGTYLLDVALQDIFECCTLRDQITYFPTYSCFPRFVCGFSSMAIVDDAGLRWNSASLKEAMEVSHKNVCL